MWECRYFFRELPATLSRDRLADLGPAMRRPVVDRDTYLLGPDVRVNVKIRFRTASIKMKQLVDSTEDGFELWRTETEVRLPASREIWEEVGSRLSLKLEAHGMATLVDPEVVVGALCDHTQETRCVQVAKERSFFVIPPGRVEFAELNAAGEIFTSIAFEASALSAARSLRSRFSGPELGEPESYISFCSRGQSSA